MHLFFLVGGEGAYLDFTSPTAVAAVTRPYYIFFWHCRSVETGPIMMVMLRRLGFVLHCVIQGELMFGNTSSERRRGCVDAGQQWVSEYRAHPP